MAKTLSSAERVTALLLTLESEDGVTSHEAWGEDMLSPHKARQLKEIRHLLSVIPGVGRSPSVYFPNEHAPALRETLEVLHRLSLILDSEE